MGWGYTCPMYDGCSETRECQSLMSWEEFGFCGGLVTSVLVITSYKWTSVAIWCTTSQVSSSHLSQIFLLPLKNICLHWYKVTRLQVHCTYLSVVVPFLLVCFLLLIGLVPPTGWSSIYHVQKLHICPHGWWRPLSWGPHCCQWWERQNQLGA